jgi:hypothetical protein
MSLSNPHPRIPANSPDLEILRSFEPIVRYTKGEKFYPMAVEPYLRESSLWLYVPDGADEEVVAEGELTLDGLVEARDAAFGSLFYLRFVYPLDLHESTEALAEARQLAKRQQNEFHAGVGRLARGGLLPRLGDGLFSLSLLLRGNVPGATAAAAELKYARIREEDPRFVYQGRVARQSGWTICQYWFFFAYNPWRSGFHGVNDHESDWEMITVYLYDDDGHLVPEWVAYASHDFHGADLRRRWDDRLELEVEGTHPVVYAGAGSHASYFRRGEYQAEVPIPYSRRLRRLSEAASRFWHTKLGQGDDTKRPLRIPFIDFARGDGVAVGPGEPNEWTPNVVDETTPWVGEYRGLWGLYAQDPISGENAPAGPMYERDGSPRPSWLDPLGFAGLDQVPPPPREIEALEREQERIGECQSELERLIPQETALLQELGVRLDSMRGSPHLASESQTLEAQAADRSAKLRELRKERFENVAVLDGLRRRLERRRAGEADDPRAHITRAAEPVAPETLRFNRAAEIWAALSISALLIGLAILILASPSNVWAELVVLVIAFIVAESVLRGTFARTVNKLAVLAALVAIAVLFVRYWELVVVAVLLALAAFLLYQRFREFTG